MPGQMEARRGENLRVYMEWKEAALEKVQMLSGVEVTIKHKQEQIRQIVVAQSTTELGTEDRDSLCVKKGRNHTEISDSEESGRSHHVENEEW